MPKGTYMLSFGEGACGSARLATNWDTLPLKPSCRNWNKWFLKICLGSWRRTIGRRGKFQMTMISSWIRHCRRSFPMKLAPEARPLQYSKARHLSMRMRCEFPIDVLLWRNFISILQLQKQQPNSPHRCPDICIQINLLCHCKHDTHRIGRVNVDGLDGLPYCFLWRLGKKRLRNMERRFEGLRRSVGSTCGKGYSPGLMWWRVVLTRVHKISSYHGLTIEFMRQRKTSVEDEVNPHLRCAHRVYYYIYWLSSSVLYGVH